MNVTKKTEEYISQRPSIKDCLKQGLINYSALSRKIAEELEIRQFDAILIACRRYRGKLERYEVSEHKIRDILKKSTLEIKNKIVVVVVEKPKHHGPILALEKRVRKENKEVHIIEGKDVLNIITQQAYLATIQEIFRASIIKINKGLIEIAIKCDERIETTPGVIAYVYSLFAEHGVNIWEEMSCWTDVMILIDEKDLGKAMNFLRF